MRQYICDSATLLFGIYIKVCIKPAISNISCYVWLKVTPISVSHLLKSDVDPLHRQCTVVGRMYCGWSDIIGMIANW